MSLLRSPSNLRPARTSGEERKGRFNLFDGRVIKEFPLVAPLITRPIDLLFPSSLIARVVPTSLILWGD
jgi:hypothetical protein